MKNEEDYKIKRGYENYEVIKYVLENRKDKISQKRLKTLEDMTSEEYHSFYFGGVTDLLFERLENK